MTVIQHLTSTYSGGSIILPVTLRKKKANNMKPVHKKRDEDWNILSDLTTDLLKSICEYLFEKFDIPE